VSRLSRKCGSLNLSQPHGPPRPINRDSFTFTCISLSLSRSLSLSPPTQIQVYNFIFSSSLLHVSAVPGHHQETVNLVKTVTLYFHCIMLSSLLLYVPLVCMFPWCWCWILQYVDPLLNNAFAKKHIPTATNPHATTEELLEMVFSTQSVPPRFYKQDNWSN
jgi:hypothetical protein